MKKRNRLLLALLLAGMLALAGCGSDSDKGAAGEVTPLETEAAAPAETQTSAETEAAAGDGAVTLGRMEGGVYTNDYAGFRCELDENWTFYTAEELQELPENVEELMSGSELGEQLSEYTNIMDMQAENVTDMVVINVGYQQLDMTTRLAYASATEMDVVQATLDQEEYLIEAYAAAGIEVSDVSAKTVTFLGEERIALHMSASIGDVNYYTLQIFGYDLGKYSVTLTLGSYVDDKTESLLDLFQPVE